jgi:AAA domain
MSIAHCGFAARKDNSLMPIDARVEIEKLMQMYKDDPRQRSFNALVEGDKGSGKTSLLRSARMPVHIDSFDPGGTIVLKDLIEKGDIIADTQYENEDPTNPTQFRAWKHMLKERINSGYFNQFATYCLDSTTSWGDAALYYVQKTIDKDSRGTIISHAGETPKWNRDYRPQRTEVENALRMLLSLPCDVILLAHLTGEYEDKMNHATGEKEAILTRYVFNGVGETKTKVPLFFSEIWVMFAEEGARGNEYKLLTQHHGFYRASTRLGREGRFEKWEKPDIKYLLKKAGWDTKDKPKLSLGVPAQQGGGSK